MEVRDVRSMRTTEGKVLTRVGPRKWKDKGDDLYFQKRVWKYSGERVAKV